MEHSDNPIKVLSVGQDSEADRIIAALSDAGIPASKQYSGRIPMPSVITGQATGEIDLYVPSSQEEAALDILVGIGALELAEEGEDPELIPDENTAEDVADAEANHKSSGWLMILVLLLAVVAVLGTDMLMDFIRKLFS